ncbi:TonB-dependent receptor [Aliikangiella marina]|uniref:TonB-dependent receptor n=1 Tax=Aliikangiella marina TaxID=1712262 RepID=A0A545TC68_9GAMM|nr:TonB-dependent receptor [Aliikangiella marina]TQV74810.1 TonB-dependent receptor [Aliikangiella marina]
MANNFRKRSLVLAMGVALSVPSVYAAEDSAETADDEAQRMVIVGSRAAPRSVGDSPVPVDVITADEMMKNGATDMTSLLAAVSPSFNVNEQPISDAATLVRPANLRGLPPDSTLILVNNKRRHRASVISFLGGGISDGSQGPDISVIPAIALKQVEVLRDGASAQYGSDAIAGVINFVLKDNSSGGSAEVRWGEYAEGDGDTLVYAVNVGTELSERGFANFSFEMKNADPTSRSIQRADAAALIAGGNTDVANPAQIWGSPEISDDMKFFVNMGLDLGDNAEAYLFGNLAQRDVDGGFFFRNPHTRGGIYSADGGATLLIGDLDPNDGIDCSSFVVPIPADGSNVRDSAAYQAVPFATYGDPSSGACWAFNELFPGGFTPTFGGQVVDSSITMGTKGEFDSGMRYDASISLGRNAVDFRIVNTVNGSLGPASPTEFEPGSYIQLEKAANFDISKDFEPEGLYGMTLSAGIERRWESFEVKAGDPASFEVGPLGFDPATGTSQGFGIGSNGFPGFQPRAQGVFDRQSTGLYLDLETYFSENFMMDFAIRYEDFSDFGDTTDWKLSGLYNVTDEFALRGSISTGFRAPTTGQSNVVNVTTAFGANGLEDQATLPPTNPISVQLGATPLKPEESESWTFGGVYEDGDWFVTFDFYNIEVTDRIAQNSPQALSQADIDALVAQGITDASSFSSVIWFTNDFDTTTEGFDLVVSYSADMWGGESDFNFAYNHTETTVDSFNAAIISETRIRQLEENLPQDRFTFTMNHTQENWNLLTRINYFGDYFEAHLDVGSLPIDASAEYTVDAEFGYDIAESFRLAVGAKNLFDEYPDENPWATIVGAQYPVTSPMGFNGRFMYLRGIYTFD